MARFRLGRAVVAAVPAVASVAASVRDPLVVATDAGRVCGVREAARWRRYRPDDRAMPTLTSAGTATVEPE